MNSLVQICRESDNTEPNQIDIKPYNEQIQQYNAILQEWEGKNQIVGEVLDKRTTFVEEWLNVFDEDYSKERLASLDQCIPDTTWVHNNNILGANLATGGGAAISLIYVAQDRLKVTRRTFLQTCIWGLMYGCGAGFVGRMVGNRTMQNRADIAYANAQYLDNVVKAIQTR